MPSYSEIAELRWGRDLVLPDIGAEVQVTPSGDWPTIAGRPNLHAAHRRRAVTAPGELVHRPDYGGGLPLFIEVENTDARRAQMAAVVRANALRDVRLEDARADVTSTTPEQVLLELALRPRGEPDTDVVTVVSEV